MADIESRYGHWCQGRPGLALDEDEELLCYAM